MKIVIDTNVLVQIMQNGDATDLSDPKTGNPIASGFRRAEALMEHIDNQKAVVVLPSPVLAEYLIGIDVGAYQQHLDIISGVSSIEVVPFDQLAAIECAMLVNAQEQKAMDADATKAKLRFDRQILAIAVACGAKELWTHDKQLYNRALETGVIPRSLADIEPMPEQIDFSQELVT